MIKVEIKCDECQKNIQVTIGESAIDSSLRWYYSYQCPFCGSAVEIDDDGFPPDEIRQNMLIEEGEWNLIIDISKLNNQVKLIKILRQSLNLSLQEVSNLLKNLPNLISGTKTEMQWLKNILSDEGIESKIEKKDVLST